MITTEQLIEHGISRDTALPMAYIINKILAGNTAEIAWKNISKLVLLPTHPFSLHRFLFSTVYPNWPAQLDCAPAYVPDLEAKA
jgi:hypothetical protein